VDGVSKLDHEQSFVLSLSKYEADTANDAKTKLKRSTQIAPKATGLLCQPPHTHINVPNRKGLTAIPMHPLRDIGSEQDLRDEPAMFSSIV